MTRGILQHAESRVNDAAAVRSPPGLSHPGGTRLPCEQAGGPVRRRSPWPAFSTSTWPESGKLAERRSTWPSAQRFATYARAARPAPPRRPSGPARSAAARRSAAFGVFSARRRAQRGSAVMSIGAAASSAAGSSAAATTKKFGKMHRLAIARTSARASGVMASVERQLRVEPRSTGPTACEVEHLARRAASAPRSSAGPRSLAGAAAATPTRSSVGRVALGRELGRPRARRGRPATRPTARSGRRAGPPYRAARAARTESMHRRGRSRRSPGTGGRRARRARRSRSPPRPSPCAIMAGSRGTPSEGSPSRVSAQPRAMPIAPWAQATTGRGAVGLARRGAGDDHPAHRDRLPVHADASCRGSATPPRPRGSPPGVKRSDRSRVPGAASAAMAGGS